MRPTTILRSARSARVLSREVAVVEDAEQLGLLVERVAERLGREGAAR
ncbi:MAG: hypothetical protein HS111_10420 [Kofleriaceae bacterium]|nr:hypothetical protein [Kofleriaceae bacterium]